MPSGGLWWDSEGGGSRGLGSSPEECRHVAEGTPTLGRGSILFGSRVGCLVIGKSLRAGVLSECRVWGFQMGGSICEGSELGEPS